MFNLPSIRLGKPFGIPLELNITWFAIFALVVVSLAFGEFPSRFEGRPLIVDLLGAIVTAILFFGSVVLHELSHSLVARSGGTRITKVTLFIFGGVAQMEEEPRSPGNELAMAAAGPLMSVVLAAVFFVAYSVLRGLGISDAFWAPLWFTSGVNMSVAVFNLMPGFPLDGGRILRAVLWWTTGDLLKATRWAASLGRGIGFLLMAAAVLGVMTGRTGLIWLGLLGWFLTSLAENALRRQEVQSALTGVTIEGVMSPSPLVVPGEMTLEQLGQDYFLGQRHTRYPVVVGGAIVGLVTLAQAKAIPRDQWGRVTVADVADRDLGGLLVSAGEPVDQVVNRLGRPGGPGALLVVKDGLVVGIVTKADVVRVLDLAAVRG